MRRAAAIGIAVGAGAVVVLGLGVSIFAASRPASPSDVAMEYLTALASGDAEAALAVTAVHDEPADEAIAAYASVSDRMSDPRVISAAGGAEDARVTVEYTLAGERRESTLHLAATQDDGWRILDAVGQVTPNATIGDSVAIGDLVLPAGDAVALLPGRYEVEPLPLGFVSGAASVDIEPGVEHELEIAASLTAEATVAAQEQLDAYIAACTVRASAVPDACGLRVPWAADLATLTSVAFRVEQQPVVELSADGTTFAATGGRVVATASGTARDGGAGAFTYRDDDWALRGTVAFQGNEMVLAVG